MGNFFIAPEEDIDAKETIDYLKKTYLDAIEVLTKYKNHFFILPIREIAIKNDSKHREILDTFLLRFISHSLNKDFSNKEEFLNNYESYEGIERDMDERIRDHFIFDELSDAGLSLRKKIEHYSQAQMNFSVLIKNKSEPEIFLILSYSWVSQIIDILLICTSLQVSPYIRFDTTFHYLTLVMYTFIEDRNLKEMIEKTIVFYIVHKTIEKDRFKNIEFNEFCKLIKNKALLDVIIRKMHALNINIFEGGFKQVQSIIIEEFNSMI